MDSVRTLMANADVSSATVRRSSQVAGVNDLIDGRCAGLRVIEFNQRARIEEIRGQGSTFPAVGNDFSGHGSGNSRKPPPDFIQAGGRAVQRPAVPA